MSPAFIHERLVSTDYRGTGSVEYIQDARTPKKVAAGKENNHAKIEPGFRIRLVKDNQLVSMFLL